MLEFSSLRVHLLPWLPAMTLGLAAAYTGNFHNGARAWPSLCGWALIAMLAALGAARYRDPLRLGRAAAVPWLGWLVMAVAGLLSPVSRAGSTAILLAPLVVLMPAGVAACWSTSRARMVGLRSISVMVLGIAAWAVWDRLGMGSSRSAMPLGHHNLLAIWLLVSWPLGAATLGERRWRWLGGATVLTAGTALLLTRSLAAAVGLGAQLLVVLIFSHRRSSRTAGGRFHSVAAAVATLAILVLLVVQAPRLGRMVGERDPSTVVRLGYLEAGWAGWLQRPLLGWGPGSSSWTIAEHLIPSPPFTPPHQVLSDLHSVPFEALYELGLVGVAALFAIVFFFAASRFREWTSRTAVDPMAAAAALGLLGIAASAPFSGIFDVVALYVAAAVTVGGLLAALDTGWRGARSWPALVVLALCLGLWSPRWLAQRSYEDYVEAVGVSARPAAQDAAAAIRRAVTLDPQLPLYRMLASEVAATASEAMEEAGRAAWTARGLSALWIREALTAASLDPARARRALETACDLDPLGGFAPFLLVQLDPGDSLAVERGARALLAEPLLAAAHLWSGRQELLSAAVDRLMAEPTIEPGWRAAADRQLRRSGDALGATVDLSLEIDGVGETSLSLFVFRRQPLPRQLVRIRLLDAEVRRIAMPPYFELEGATTEMLRAQCRLR